MKYITLLLLTAFVATPIQARNVERVAAPQSDEPATGSFGSTYKTYEYNEDVIRSGQSATKRDDKNSTIKRRCQNLNGEWLRPIDVGYDACMSDSRTLKK